MDMDLSDWLSTGPNTLSGVFGLHFSNPQLWAPAARDVGQLGSMAGTHFMTEKQNPEKVFIFEGKDFICYFLSDRWSGGNNPVYI